MNNGKVRIYELSRELNLDNKDILNICEGLHIAVKSHSSTITESEAQRIRAAAEKYAEGSTAIRSRDHATVTEGISKSPSSHNTGHPNNQRKQQILSLKPKSRPTSSSQPGASQVATPPQPPVNPSVSSPRPSISLNRPKRVGESDVNSEPVTEPEPQVPQEKAVSVQIIEEKPQLVQPPVRPAAPKAQLAQVERPILKRDRQETPAPESSSPPTVPSPITPKQAPTAGDASPPKRPSPTRPVAQPVPKLQGPPRRAKPTREDNAEVVAEGGLTPKIAGEGVLDEDETLIETPEDLLKDLKLRRPTPPRQLKKKEWVDEEEEPELAKPGKAGAKLKRRPQLIEDEDDDFETDLKNLNTSVMAIEAIARPPKPKSRPGAGSPVASVPTVTQKKKPGVKTSGGSSSKSESRSQRDKKGVPERPEKIILTDSLTVRELATKMAVPETEIIKKLFFRGLAVNITQSLDVGTASAIAEEMGVEVETAEEAAAATKVTEMLDAEDMENLVWRPPVVTIMGHVDHGKTTLLDAIRETKVAQGEAGGITQHIGAYHVDVEHEGETQQVVFLDTPGHEAFTAMRARGARVTDIAILVVAADDGVQPQTIEALSHAKAAEVPIVVAINKIDKEGASPDRVKQELMGYGLVPEEWGGDAIMVPVSAIQKENLDTLLEMILLVAEVEDLQANPNRPAKGTVIEANLDKARGPVATLLVQNGTLRVGDTLVAGSVFGKVRAMIDDRGAKVDEAAPSFAVEVLGLSDVPAAGDEFEVFESEKEARSIASDRTDEQRLSRLQQVMASRRVTLNSLSAQAQEGELKELNLILKADVQGSVEAILGALKQLPQNEVQIRVLLGAAGEITETDVDLAAASGAVIIGFNTALAHGARHAAEQEGVDVREYNIIYNLLDDIQGAMEGLLEPEQVEEALGQVAVRAVFPVGRGAVAGCYVQSGKAIRNCNIRVRRGSKVIYEGILDSLKRMKEDVKEVNAGYECGIGIDKFNDWAEGDIIETFKMVTKRRTLSAS